MYTWMLGETLQTAWNDEAIIVPSSKNEHFESHGNKLTVIVPTILTGNQFGLYEIEMAPKARGPKLHYHKVMDETFVIHEGILTVLTSKGETKVEAGSVVHLPRLTCHGYNNDTDGIVKMTMLFTPGHNREDFFRRMYKMLEESPGDLEAFQKLYLEYDSYSLNVKDMIPMRK
ncbi:cupin domain-containing protein [Pedobacter ginsengisoli]|uniref:cupin domain-containing protein n=1 Tax=Pedobacter ginsengisoli TaxID=363852 RepID=UPI00254D053D|nr:cupin domain-containing protein [Pedobacter ginsengisoli]